jgi:hypothetical protein
MNWEAIGAIGEILGALVVVITLVYLASQVRHAKDASADTNRLERSKGVRDMLMASTLNSDLSKAMAKGLKAQDYYTEIAPKLDLSVEEAAQFDWAMAYYFWLHWGQYASTTKESDIQELEKLVAAFYTHPSVRLCWEKGPWVKPLLEDSFVNFVDEILTRHQD